MSCRMEFALPGTDTVNKIVYACGYETPADTASTEERMARYNKIRDAAGGDDSAEFVPAKNLTALEPRGFLEIESTPDKMTIAIVRAPLAKFPDQTAPTCSQPAIIGRPPKVVVYPTSNPKY